jgi:hypothetical protein
MEDAGFIIASYAITLGAIALYAWRTLTHARRLARRLPDEHKPWT